MSTSEENQRIAADSIVRQWQSDGRLDVVAVPVRGMEVDDQSGWYELQAKVDKGLTCEDVLGRGEDLGIRHQMERAIIRQGLDWAKANSKVRRLSLRVSQFSLLVPGVVDRLFHDISSSGMAPSRLCIDIISMDNIQYFSHLIEVAGRFREFGASVVLDRLDDEDTRRLFPSGLRFDYFRIRERYTRGIPDNTTSMLAIQALEERLTGSRVRLLAESVHSEAQKDALAESGVAFFIKAVDAQAVDISDSEDVQPGAQQA